MTIDARLERLCENVELVRGVDNPKRGQFCIMSFVALLAGEVHSDDPATASRTIRRFAMIVSDDMPDQLRQRLKLFAPRIVGTRDGQDQLRAKLLIHAAREELLPRIFVEFQKADTYSELQEWVVLLSSYGCESEAWMDGDEIANTVAQLISVCCRLASTPQQRDWYSMKAIELLDRLCDIGSAGRTAVHSLGAHDRDRGHL